MATLAHAPKFAHDCDCCTFIAHVAPDQGAAFDLYTHGADVMARTSSDGPDYHSMPLAFAPHFKGDVQSTLGRAFWMHQRLTERRFGQCLAA